MFIKVLGTGCPKCNKLFGLVSEVIEENNLDAQVTHISDMSLIMAYPVLGTPALVIDEKVVSYGKVPSKEEILKYIKNAGGIEA